MDNISASVSGTVLIAYMSSLTSASFTATQYALFSSLYSILGKLVASQSGRIVEASARGADHGGVASLFTGLMAHLHSDSYVAPAAKLGVTPAALGAGYFTFFAYTIVIGFVSIAMSVWLYYRRRPI
jgi:PAT family beta-lactamase induction signal transducer AmpG